MKSLTFLFMAEGKNKLRELFHSPARFLLTALFLLSAVINLRVEMTVEPGTRDIGEFFAIVFLFYVLCFVTEGRKGFSGGGSMFSMTDVNLLFMMPHKSSLILLFGMIRSFGSSLWMGLIFIYQYSLLRSNYPIELTDLIFAVIGYGTVAFLSRTVGMLIYFFTCGNEKRVKTAEKFFYAVAVVFVFIFLFSGGVLINPTLEKIVSAAENPVMKLFPVSGLVSFAFESFVKGNTVPVIFATVLSAAFVIFSFFFMSRSQRSYYEDVLLTAEKSTGSVGKSEKRNEDTAFVRVGKNGIGKGRGASVFLFKHLKENRRGKSALLSANSLFYLVMLGVYAFVFKNSPLTVFVFSCTTSIFTVLGGRWVRELDMPYVYMLPSGSFSKLFFILPEMLPGLVVESVLHFVLVGAIYRMSLPMIFSMVASRLGVSFVILAAGLVASRFFTERTKSAAYVMASLGFAMLFLLPALLSGIICVFFGSGIVFSLWATVPVNLCVFALVLLLSKNMLKK